MGHGNDERLIDGLGRLPPDALDEPEGAPELFERMLARTTGVVRRRRRLRGALTAVAAILIFVAGAWTGRLLSRPEARLPLGPGLEGAKPPALASAPLPLDPRSLEDRLAKVRPGERARLLREAGDGYLSAERADPEAALYCYRRLLDDPGGAAAVAPAGDDSWLLLYLKLARPTE